MEPIKVLNILQSLQDLNGLIILECYIRGSGSTVMMQPVFSRLEKRYKNCIQHLKFSMEDYPEIIEHYYLLHIPAFLILHKGELLERVEGLIPGPEFEAIVDQIWIDGKFSDSVS